MRAGTIVMLEIFIYTKHIFNQSPYDEVIGKLGKEKFAFTIERLSISNFSFRRSARRKIVSFYNKTLSSAIGSQLRGWLGGCEYHIHLGDRSAR